MSLELYRKAQKKGEHAYRKALLSGAYPYPQVLEDILSHESQVAEVPIGLHDIPLDFIAGTYTDGRRNSFANNFMPLLDEDTEFAVKWSRLADAHLAEGIQSPIKVYEYFHRFYVMEGNKRVSVLKYFDADSISGNVIRVLPPHNGAKRNRVYYEYLKFYHYCPVLFLEFTELGSYEEFQKFAGKAPEETWSTEEIRSLRMMHYRFRKAFMEVCGTTLTDVTPSDALLVYLHFYSYEEALNTQDFRENLKKIQEEITLLSKDQSVDLVLEPEDAPRRGLFGMFFQENPDRKLNIAFIFHKNPQVSTWAYGHELGMRHLEEKFKDQISVTRYQDITLETIDETLEDAIRNGADIIFSTTEIFIEHCNKAAAMHPKVNILSCGVNVAHVYISCYSARLYEAKYLSGLIAGSVCKDGKIGYLADNPSYGNIASVNAFAIGCQTVNPDAKVYLQWAAKKDADPEKFFRDHDISIISGRDIGTGSQSREFGLYQKTENGIQNLAVAILNWGVFYERLVKSILTGAFNETEKQSGGHAVNYWWGFRADVLDLVMDDDISPATRNLVRFLEKEIRNNLFHPFYGELYSQTGRVDNSDDQVISPKGIATMAWLNQNIVGSIPDISELTPAARALMMIQEETKEKPNEDSGSIGL